MKKLGRKHKEETRKTRGSFTFANKKKKDAEAENIIATLEDPQGRANVQEAVAAFIQKRDPIFQ